MLENGSLEDLIKSSAVFSWKLVLQICQGIVAGVYHLHKEKILHRYVAIYTADCNRDLAARNILLRANYEPLIADFGLSKRVSYKQLKEPTEKGTLKTKEEGFFRGPYKW
jgi:serine/threonine protein kinase